MRRRARPSGRFTASGEFHPALKQQRHRNTSLGARTAQTHQSQREAGKRCREAPEGIPEKHSSGPRMKQGENAGIPLRIPKANIPQAVRPRTFAWEPQGDSGGSRTSLRSPRPRRCRRTRGASPSPQAWVDAGWNRCRRRRWRRRQRGHASPRTRRSRSPTRLPSRRRGRSS